LNLAVRPRRLRSADVRALKLSAARIRSVPELATTFQAAGLEVAVSTGGEPWPLPPGTDVAAYRIIQETLTNVTKHSAAEAQARLDSTGDRLNIKITDDGGASPVRAQSAPSSGCGLIGTRERWRTCCGCRPRGTLHTARGGISALRPVARWLIRIPGRCRGGSGCGGPFGRCGWWR